MKATRTFNADLVRAFMTRPEIWDTVAEDGQDPAEFEPDVNAECWLVLTLEDGTLVGLYCIHQRNAVTYEIHAQVLTEHRKVYSSATGEAALTWLMDNVPGCQKVIASVPTIYPNVRDFAVSQGFQIEGINRHSYLKRGEIHDQWMLGATREEIDG